MGGEFLLGVSAENRAGAGVAAGIHLGISCPNALMQETVRAYYTGENRDIVTVLPRIEGGFAYPPEGSGLGTALQPAF